MFRKYHSPTDDQTVMFDDPYGQIDMIQLQRDFFSPAICNNSFCRGTFPKFLKHNISIQMPIQYINDKWRISIDRLGTGPHGYTCTMVIY